MNSLKYSVSADIYRQHPGYIRTVLVVTNINNSGPNEQALDFLRNVEFQFCTQYTPESFGTAPRVDNWRRAFRVMGVNPNEIRPSHDAMGRRTAQKKLLPNINPLVNLMNGLSLSHLVPVGAHPIKNGDNLVVLRRASGDERFIAFGSNKVERPARGEIVLASDNNVWARHWVWRQSKDSITLPETSCLFINIDCLPPLTVEDAEQIAAEADRLLRQHCGATQIMKHHLTSTNPAFEVVIPDDGHSIPQLHNMEETVGW